MTIMHWIWEDLLEKEMATHSSILPWRIPWTEEPGGLPSMGWQSQTRLSDWAHWVCTMWQALLCFIHMFSFNPHNDLIALLWLFYSKGDWNLGLDQSLKGAEYSLCLLYFNCDFSYCFILPRGVWARGNKNVLGRRNNICKEEGPKGTWHLLETFKHKEVVGNQPPVN